MSTNPVMRAIEDKDYANTLVEKVLAASAVPRTKDGDQTPEWSDLLSEFADSPEQLGKMAARAEATSIPTTTTTTTTITGTSMLTLLSTLECLHLTFTIVEMSEI